MIKLGLSIDEDEEADEMNDMPPLEENDEDQTESKMEEVD